MFLLLFLKKDPPVIVYRDLSLPKWSELYVHAGSDKGKLGFISDQIFLSCPLGSVVHVKAEKLTL